MLIHIKEDAQIYGLGQPLPLGKAEEAKAEGGRVCFVLSEQFDSATTRMRLIIVGTIHV